MYIHDSRAKVQPSDVVCLRSLTNNHYFIILKGIILVFQVLIHHGTDTGIRPYIFSRFYHVDDGIDWQDIQCKLGVKMVRKEIIYVTKEDIQMPGLWVRDRSI